jgi:hypothetical protein
MTGAQLEILVDGKPRSYRDTKSGAMDAATFLKGRQPHSEVAAPALWIGYPRSVLGAPSPRRSSSRIAVARFGIRVWNRNSSIAAISSVDTLTCTRSVRSGVDSVPNALLALVLPGRLAITPPPEKCGKNALQRKKFQLARMK